MASISSKTSPYRKIDQHWIEACSPRSVRSGLEESRNETADNRYKADDVAKQIKELHAIKLRRQARTAYR